MPELPEVETTVRGLERVLKGRRLKMVEPRRADLRRSIPHDLGQRLTGAKVTELGRRAKYGLIATDRGDTLIFHLGMSGRWRIDPDRMGAAVAEMTARLLIIQGDGDYAAAVRWYESTGTVDDVVRSDVERVARQGIPIDVVYEQGLEVLGLA